LLMFFDARRGSLLHFIGWGEEDCNEFDIVNQVFGSSSFLPHSFFFLKFFCHDDDHEFMIQLSSYSFLFH
jgi:hypothetical protein